MLEHPMRVTAKDLLGTPAPVGYEQEEEVGRKPVGLPTLVAASPDTGVNTLTGEGLAETLDRATVVVDVSNSPSFEDAAVLTFFETSTRNLLAAESAAGV